MKKRRYNYAYGKRKTTKTESKDDKRRQNDQKEREKKDGTREQTNKIKVKLIKEQPQNQKNPKDNQTG
jgi:hypothetical protein